MEAPPVASTPSIGAPALPGAAIQAVVQAGPTETRYCRAGSGAPVLLLGSGGMAGPLTLPLFRALAGSFRVLAPEPPGNVGGEIPSFSGAPGGSVHHWLRDVIDGLGLIRPGIVADERFGILALDFALADPERVGRLALVRRDAFDPDSWTAAQEDELRRSGHPLLVLRIGAETGPEVEPSAGEALVRFLEERSS